MYGKVRQITPSELERLQDSPADVEEFIQGNMLARAAKIAAALEEQSKTARAAGRQISPAEEGKLRSEIFKKLMDESSLLHDGPNENGLSLEKSWHAIHYLLTGKADQAPPPLGNAVLGGEEIGEDRDYGRVRFLTPQQVREVAKALASIFKDDLGRRFDVEKMKAANVIYPCRDKSDLELAQHYFEHLSRYYADAAANGNAMLLWVE